MRDLNQYTLNHTASHQCQAAEPPHAAAPFDAAAVSKAKKLKALIADGDKVIAGRFRTKVCRNFVERGLCPYESRCMFAHGSHQLRTKAMNLRDGIVNEEAIRDFKRVVSSKARDWATESPRPSEEQLFSEYQTVASDGQSSELRSQPPTSPRQVNSSASSVSAAKATTFRSQASFNASPTGARPSSSNASHAPDEDDAIRPSLMRSPSPSPSSASGWYRHNPYAWSALAPESLC